MKKFSEKNLKKTGLNCISIAINAERNIKYIDEDFEKWEEWLEFEQKYTRRVTGAIFGNKEDTDESILIGRISGIYFEPEIQIEDTNFWDVCDSINGDLEYMASTIVDKKLNVKEDVCTMNNSIFYLDEIFIDEPYRSHGIGKFVLEQLDKFMMYTSNLDIGTVVTYPYAMEGTAKDGYRGIEDEEKRKETLKRLQKFYKACGFKKIGRRGHMYKKYGDTFDYYK